jgi:hypothetical protein
MDWATGILEACRSSSSYTYAANHAEIILLAGSVLFLLLRGNWRGALVLVFGGVLCYANYYMFAQQLYFKMSPVYAAALAGTSVFLLILLVYQLIHAD